MDADLAFAADRPHRRDVMRAPRIQGFTRLCKTPGHWPGVIYCNTAAPSTVSTSRLAEPTCTCMRPLMVK